MVIAVPWRTPVGDTAPGSEERLGGEKTDDEPRSDITANIQEVPTAGATAPPHARPEPGGGWGPQVSPRYSENFDTRSWVWNTSGGELYIALEGVRSATARGPGSCRGEAMAPAADAPPRPEGVGVQVVSGMERRVEDGPQAGPGQV